MKLELTTEEWHILSISLSARISSLNRQIQKYNPDAEVLEQRLKDTRELKSKLVRLIQ